MAVLLEGITGIKRVPDVEAIFFSDNCVMKSSNALTAHEAKRVTWTAAPHTGKIKLPNGSEIPSGVTSFASGDKGQYFFVMSTPSVWEAVGVGKRPALDTVMATARRPSWRCSMQRWPNSAPPAFPPLFAPGR